MYLNDHFNSVVIDLYKNLNYFPHGVLYMLYKNICLL